MSRHASFLLLTAMTFAIRSGPAFAQVEAPDRRFVDTLLRCREQREAAARLACFDERSAALAQAKNQGDVVVVERAEVQRTRRSLFGLALPRMPFLEAPKKDSASPPPELLETKLVRAADAPNGYVQLVLEEGGIWRTTDPWSGSLPRPGVPVVVKRGNLGSFTVRVGGGRYYRAERIR